MRPVGSRTSGLLVAEAVETIAAARRLMPDAIEASRQAYLAERSPARYARAFVAALGLDR